MCSPVDAAVVPVRLSSWATWIMRVMGQGKQAQLLSDGTEQVLLLAFQGGKPGRSRRQRKTAEGRLQPAGADRLGWGRTSSAARSAATLWSVATRPVEHNADYAGASRTLAKGRRPKGECPLDSAHNPPALCLAGRFKAPFGGWGANAAVLAQPSLRAGVNKHRNTCVSRCCTRPLARSGNEVDQVSGWQGGA